VSRRPLVLCYHAVDDAWDDTLAVRREELERQLRTIARFRRVHVTFDDAFRSVLDALPVLERLRVRTTVFACSGYGDGRPLDIDELRGDRFDARALATLTYDELRMLRRRGVEIGSHTITHAHLTRLDDAELGRELTESRARLEDELGEPVTTLAYPYGEEDARVRAAARAAGYVEAYGLPGRRGDDFSLRRLGIWRRDSLTRAAAKALAAPFRP
jgi:peptidoglycan/xylan/chitin deacetylase (PgdA/CDA1 family)